MATPRPKPSQTPIPSPTIVPTTPSPSSNDDGDSHFILYIIIGVIGLLSVGGPLVSWIMAGGASDSVSDIKKQLRGDAAQNAKRIKSLEDENAGLRRQLTSLVEKVNAHSNAINKIATMSKDLKGQLIEVQAGAQLESLQNMRSERPFPKPVEDLLAEHLHEGRSVAVDDLTKCLVENTAKGDHFLLFQADLTGSDMAYVVPRVSSFTTKNDYLNFFQRFYRCDAPAGGEVWIKELAIVRKVPNGWELHKAGDLEVR